MPSSRSSDKPSASRSNPPQKSYRHVAIIFVILAILLVLGVTYLALSKVTITLIPSDKQVSYNFTLTIAENASSSDLTIPGKILSDNVKASQEFFVEEGKTVDAQAEGSLTILNDRDQSQTLVASTRFLTPDNILFRLKDQVSIPAHSQVQAKVYADQPGASGNIGPSAFTLPGLSENLQKLVYAESTSSMVGGTRQIGVLTTQDIQRAESELIKNNTSQKMAEFISQLKDENLTLIDSLVTTSGLSYNKQLGEEVSSFTLSATINITAVFAQREQILEMAKNKLKESQGPKGEFINVDPSSLKYKLAEVASDKSEAQLDVEISGLTSFDPNKDIFDKNLLVGFTEDDLKLYFSQFESIKSIRVEFSPFWVKKVPILKDHIYIKVENE
jgi:hypothetical protein